MRSDLAGDEAPPPTSSGVTGRRLLWLAALLALLLHSMVIGLLVRQKANTEPLVQEAAIPIEIVPPPAPPPPGPPPLPQPKVEPKPPEPEKPLFSGAKADASKPQATAPQTEDSVDNAVKTPGDTTEKPPEVATPQEAQTPEPVPAPTPSPAPEPAAPAPVEAAVPQPPTPSPPVVQEAAKPTPEPTPEPAPAPTPEPAPASAQAPTPTPKPEAPALPAKPATQSTPSPSEIASLPPLKAQPPSKKGPAKKQVKRQGSSAPGDPYLNAIRDRINGHLRYPDLARPLGLKGETIFTVWVDRGGGLKYLDLVQSSGSTLLDDAVEQAIRASVPLPPAPSYIRYDLIKLTVAIPMAPD